MLRRASELFLGALEQKSLVKARLKYVSAEKHGSSEYDQVFLAQEEDSGNHATSTCEASGPNKRKVDSFDVELKWFISDNIEEARKLKQAGLEVGKTSHTFEYVSVSIDVIPQEDKDGGEGGGRVKVGFEATTMEPRLSRATFVALGAEAEPNSLHLVLDEREIADIKTCCVHEAAQASFFRWLSTFTFSGLSRVDCSHCGMTQFPESLSASHVAGQLRSLCVSHNKIAEIPDRVISKLVNLEVLECCNNLLAALPASLSTLMRLHTLDLEDNRLTTIICPFNKLTRLRKLLLKGNSLLYLPPLVGNVTLRELSIANLVIRGRVRANEERLERSDRRTRTSASSSDHLKYEGVTTSFSETSSFLSPLKNAISSNKWIPFFDLFVGRSEAHPLVLAAILQAFEDTEACEYVASQERGVLQQLVLLTLSNDVDVVQRSSQCLISAFSKCQNIMDRLLENNMQQCVSTLLGSDKIIDQEAGIKLLSHIALSDQFSSAIFNDTIVTLLATIASQQAFRWLQPSPSGSQDPSQAELRDRRGGLDHCGKALECLGNVALSLRNREKMVANGALLRVLDLVCSLGGEHRSKMEAEAARLRDKERAGGGSPRKHEDRATRARLSSECVANAAVAVRCAVRALAILGLNDRVDAAVALQGAGGSSAARRGGGVRILSIDGGGAKGRCALEMCRVIERKTGKRIYELFDLIVGTSTGSVIAVGLGVLGLRVDEVEEAYDTLTKAFKTSGKDAGWTEQLSGLVTAGTQNIRAIFRGCLYNHEVLQEFYKRWVRIPDQVDDDRFCAYSRAMINIAPLGRPRVACLASLTNCARPQGYILRTYEFPPGEGGAYRREMCRDGREGGQGILDGTSGFALWQGLRASTAAPLYVEGYVHGKRLFLQDGALCSNNPVVVAFQEAACVWPDRPVDVVVSLGNGVPRHVLLPPKPKSVMETMGAIVEAATSVDRDHIVMEGIAGYLNREARRTGGRRACGYYRFQPEDDRCDLMLDEVSESKLAALRDAYVEYIKGKEKEFDEVCRELVRAGQGGEGAAFGEREQQMMEPAAMAPRASAVCVQDPSLLRHGREAGAGTRPLFEACLRNEECGLRIISAAAVASCTSEAPVFVRSSPSAADAAAPLLPPDPACSGAKALARASLVLVDCVALEGGFVCEWREGEPLAVEEGTAVEAALLADMNAERETLTLRQHYSRRSWGLAAAGDHAVEFCDARTTVRGPAAATVCFLRRLLPSRTLWPSRGAKGKVFCCTWPLPPELEGALLAAGASAVVCPAGEAAMTSSGDHAAALYGRILETGCAASSWEWLLHRWPEATKVLRCATGPAS